MAKTPHPESPREARMAESPRGARAADEPRRGPRLRVWWVFLAIVLVVYVLYTIWLGGAYQTAGPFVAGQCSAVDAPAGPEDILILPDGKAALISAQDRRNRQSDGGLWLYDLSRQPAVPQQLAVPAGMPFHPQGLSLYTAADGTWYLQVINNRSDERRTVEIFVIEGEGSALKLRHRGTISSDLFISPNALAATGPESFYLTNDRGSGPRWMHAVENILQLSRSTIVLNDERGARLAAEDIAFANGIALGRDGESLVVGSTLWRMLLAYQRDPLSGLIKRTGSLALPGGVDNLRLDDEGDLWAALHVNSFAFIGHARNPEKQSPSRIVRIHSDLRGATRVQEVFADPGELLSGASVAAHHRGRLLIGATFQPRILDCQLDPAKFRDID